jgi:hypothetical protein
MSQFIKFIFNKGKSGKIIWKEQNLFVSVFEPSLQLIIIGAEL